MAQAKDRPRRCYEGGLIRLDKEGNWFHDGERITHALTAELFSRSVQKDPAGGYMLVVEPEYCHIEVEDTPFMVRRVDLGEDGASIRLNDGTEERLDPSTLHVGEANVLYCSVKAGEFPARFLRPAYYQIMQALTETQDGYALEIGGRQWPVGESENDS